MGLACFFGDRVNSGVDDLSLLTPVLSPCCKLVNGLLNPVVGCACMFLFAP